MEQIILAILMGLVATLINAGCASKQYIMEDCKKVVDAEDKPTGEQVCKKSGPWYQ